MSRLLQLISSMPAIIYNCLPGRTLKGAFISLYSKFTQMHALNKMVANTEVLEDGSVYIEMEDGTKFYGEKDIFTSERDVTHEVLQKLDKLNKLQYSRHVLGALCTQYVKTEYEKNYKLKKGDIVVDAGAHIGTFTIKAAKAVGNDGKVVAIEPDANNFRFLSRNVEANGLQNVSIINKGVWGIQDKLRFNISRKRTTGHSFYRNKQFGTENTEEFIEVEVDTIDNIIGQSGIGPVNFIKMDIEGAEVEAIKGMDEALSGDAKLAMEGCHRVNGQMTYKVVIPWLKKKGFQVRRNGRIIYAEKTI